MPAGRGVRRRSRAPAGSSAATWSPTAPRSRRRVHVRDASFVNLQALRPMARGAYLADLIVMIGEPRQGHGRGRPVTADEVRPTWSRSATSSPTSRSLMLPALKHAQTEKGWLAPEDVDAVAEALDLTPAYVESIGIFYDRLYLRPIGTARDLGLRDLSCMLRGSDGLPFEHLCDRAGVGHHGGTSEDGAFTLQEAQCLGACDRAPCVQVDAEETVGPFTLEAADACSTTTNPAFSSTNVKPRRSSASSSPMTTFMRTLPRLTVADRAPDHFVPARPDQCRPPCSGAE